MYKGVKKSKLGRKASNRKSLMKNQIRSLFESSKVVTTSPKAKVLKGNVESLIGQGKKKSSELEFRRRVIEMLGSDELVKKFFEYIKKEETGARIIKVGFRKGDNGEKSRVELIGMEKKAKKAVEKKSGEKEETKVDSKKSGEALKDMMKAKEKSVGKNTVVKKAERAKSRSGL